MIRQFTFDLYIREKKIKMIEGVDVSEALINAMTDTSGTYLSTGSTLTIRPYANDSSLVSTKVLFQNASIE